MIGYAGYGSCGCFGGLRIPPDLVSAGDLIVALLLWWSAGQRNVQGHTSTPYVLTGILAGLALAWPWVSGAGVGALRGRTIVLTPSVWPGSSVDVLSPLLSWAGARDLASVRESLLVLYSSECGRCCTRLDMLGRLWGSRSPFLLVDIARGSGACPPAEIRRPNWRPVHVAADYVLVVERVPWFVLIRNGVVRSAVEDPRQLPGLPGEEPDRS